MRANLPALDNILVFQPLSRFLILLIIGCHVSTLSGLAPSGMPRYFTSKDRTAQSNFDFILFTQDASQLTGMMADFS